MWRAAGLAVFLAMVVFSQLAPALDPAPASLAPPARTGPRSPSLRPVDAEALGRLFFVPRPRVARPPPRVRVLGTLDGPRPEDGLAALELPGEPRTHLLGVGDAVGDCRVASIAHGRVWAWCAGRQEELSAPVASAAAAPAAHPGALVQAVGEGRYAIDTRALESRLPALLPTLMEGTHLVPRFAGTVHEGFVLYFRPGSLLEAAGLRSGDVLLRVDGETLTPQVAMRLAATWKERSAVAVEVRRAGALMTLRLEAR